MSSKTTTHYSKVMSPVTGLGQKYVDTSTKHHAFVGYVIPKPCVLICCCNSHSSGVLGFPPDVDNILKTEKEDKDIIEITARKEQKRKLCWCRHYLSSTCKVYRNKSRYKVCVTGRHKQTMSSSQQWPQIRKYS